MQLQKCSSKATNLEWGGPDLECGMSGWPIGVHEHFFNFNTPTQVDVNLPPNLAVLDATFGGTFPLNAKDHPGHCLQYDPCLIATSPQESAISH
jgi:hypothetical protein